MSNDPQAEHFEKWMRYLRETRAAAEPWEKQAIEYQKFSLEYSKLLVTNLYVINAGGLLSLPVLSNFLGISPLPRAERLWVLGLGAGGFVLGLLLAAMCSLAVYFNYQRHAEHARSRAAEDQYSVGVTLGIQGKDKDERDRIQAELKEDIASLVRGVNRTFFLAHGAGWLSIASFLAAAYWLAVNLR